jgi:HlyD family secretion protein
MRGIPWYPLVLSCALLLAGCATGVALTPTSLDTPTPYIFRLDGEQATPTAAPTPTPPAAPTPPATYAIPVDGELVGLYPPLKVSFAVGGELLDLHVELGQRVQAGDPIATLDDGALQEAVDAAQRDLDEAREAEARAEEDAEQAYQLALEDAEWKVKNAKHALLAAELLPPTLSVRQAEQGLERACEIEALAADNYQRSFDRPWAPQGERDALYKEWQVRIADRELAELRLEQAQTQINLYYMELALKREAVARAESALARVEKTVNPAYAEAVRGAEAALDEAQERLSLAKLYAPRPGLVVSVDAVEGTVVSEGTPVVTLLDVTDLRFVTLNLDERHAALLRPGQPANIVLRFYPDAPVRGEVDVVLPPLGGASGARFVAHIRIVDDAGLDLLPGMTGRAEIVLEAR